MSNKLPEIKLNIKVSEIKAKPRMLRTSWSQQAANDLRALYEPDEVTITPLQELAEALDDPNYDPEDQESVRKWREARSRKSAERRLMEDMADEMVAEIDREIARDLAAMTTTDQFNHIIFSTPGAKIGNRIKEALDTARHGELSPNLGQDIRVLLHEEELLRDKRIRALGTE